VPRIPSCTRSLRSPGSSMPQPLPRRLRALRQDGVPGDGGKKERPSPRPPVANFLISGRPARSLATPDGRAVRVHADFSPRGSIRTPTPLQFPDLNVACLAQAPLWFHSQKEQDSHAYPCASASRGCVHNLHVALRVHFQEVSEQPPRGHELCSRCAAKPSAQGPTLSKEPPLLKAYLDSGSF